MNMHHMFLFDSWLMKALGNSPCTTLKQSHIDFPGSSHERWIQDDPQISFSTTSSVWWADYFDV